MDHDFCHRTLKCSTRVRAAALCALATLLSLSGCAGDPQTFSYYSRDDALPAATASGLPEPGSTVCLASAGGYPAALDVFLRRALTDRGYRVVMEAPRSGVCRFQVLMTARAGANPGELPQWMSLDFRDLYTGETQHADWRRSEVRPAFIRTHSALSPSDGSALIAGPYVDPAMIVTNLVDQLFPTPTAAKK